MKNIEEYTDSQLEDIFDSLDSEDESGEARRAYAAVASRLGFRRQRNTIRKVALKVSAVVAAAACAAGLFFGGIAYESAAERKVYWSEVTVPEGQHRDIVLSDGTRLLLKAGSRITYPSAFKSDRRQIFL